MAQVRRSADLKVSRPLKLRRLRPRDDGAGSPNAQCACETTSVKFVDERNGSGLLPAGGCRCQVVVARLEVVVEVHGTRLFSRGWSRDAQREGGRQVFDS